MWSFKCSHSSFDTVMQITRKQSLFSKYLPLTVAAKSMFLYLFFLSNFVIYDIHVAATGRKKKHASSELLAIYTIMTINIVHPTYNSTANGISQKRKLFYEKEGNMLPLCLCRVHCVYPYTGTHISRQLISPVARQLFFFKCLVYSR